MKKATGSQDRQFKNKALQYRKAMHLAYDSGLWDATVSNAVHSLILMANALTARESGEYFADKDHTQAPQYLKEVLGPVASKAKEQMAQVLNMKGLVEYEARACTRNDASGTVKRVERFFSWAEQQMP